MTAALAARIAAILTTLAEVDGSPESMLYLALGGDITLWNRLRGIMVAAGWIAVKGHYVTLTDAGRVVAGDIVTARAA